MEGGHGSGDNLTRTPLSNDANAIFKAAQSRWLNVTELEILLSPMTTPLQVRPKPPTSCPPSGSLLLYDRAVTRNYKEDGYDWVKKRNSSKVREDHVKLRVGGRFRVAGCYVHCSTIASLHRRAYHLLDPDTGTARNPPSSASFTPGAPVAGAHRIGDVMPGGKSLILMHYLDTEVAATQAAVGTTMSAVVPDPLTPPLSSGFRVGPGSKDRTKTDPKKRTTRTTKQPGQRRPRKSNGVAALKAPASVPALSAVISPPVPNTNNPARTPQGQEAAQYAPPDQTKSGADTANHTSSSVFSSFEDFSPLHEGNHIRDASTSIDDETLNILWGMVVEEGDGDIGKFIENRGSLEAMFESSGALNLMDCEDGKSTTAAVAASAVSALEQELRAAQLNLGCQLERNHSGDDPSLATRNGIDETPARAASDESVTRNSAGAQEEAGCVRPKYSRRASEPRLCASQMEQPDLVVSESSSKSQEQREPRPMKCARKTVVTSSIEVLESDNPQRGAVDCLPNIVDFTPEHTALKSDREPLKVFICVDTPFLDHELTGSVPDWYHVAAFVDAVTTDAGELDIRSLHLSPVTLINPYCCKCYLSLDGITAGDRRIIVAATRSQTSDVVLDEMASALRASLEQAWAKTKHVNPHDDAGPKLYSLQELSSVGDPSSLRLQTQLSREVFRFEVPSDTSPEGGTALLNVEMESEDVSKTVPAPSHDETSRDLPAPPPAMAMVATVLSDFPNPPAEAVIEPDSMVQTVDSFVSSNSTNIERERNSAVLTELSELSDIPGAGEAVAAALEATVNPPEGTRKRRGGKIEAVALSVDSASATTTAATQWASTPAKNSMDETIGEEVDRHCKVRFVERLTTVIAGAEEASDASKMKGDPWTIPCVSTSALPQLDNEATQSMEVVTGETATPSRNNLETSPEQVLSDRLMSLDDQDFRGLDDDTFEGLLDSLLVRVVESLVEVSALSDEMQRELNEPDKSGFTLLHYASLYNLQSLVPILLSRGAHPDTPTERGNLTALHLACGSGNWAIVELLVRHGCDVSVRDSFGSNACDHALRNGFTEIGDWLRERCEVGDNHDDVEAGKTEKERAPDRSTYQIGSLSPQASEASEYSRTKSRSRRGIDKENAKSMLQTAFANLSLKDKLVLRLMVQNKPRESECRREGTRKNGKKRGDRFSARVKVEEMTRVDEDPDEKMADSTYQEPHAFGKVSNVLGSLHLVRPIASGERYEDDDRSVKTAPTMSHSESYWNDSQHGCVDAKEMEDWEDEDGEEDDSDADVDVSSVIGENDRESLDIAMRMMNQEEIDDLESKSRGIDDDVRKWMLRRNYESLKEASQYLERTRQSQLRQKASNDEDEVRESVKSGAVPGPPAQVVTRKSLATVKERAIAGLVIRRNMSRNKTGSELKKVS